MIVKCRLHGQVYASVENTYDAYKHTHTKHTHTGFTEEGRQFDANANDELFKVTIGARQILQVLSEYVCLCVCVCVCVCGYLVLSRTMVGGVRHFVKSS